MEKIKRILIDNLNIDTTKPIGVSNWGKVKVGNEIALVKKKLPKHKESELQQSCVKWFTYQYPMYWLFSIKNSSKMGGKKIKGKNGKQIPLEAIIAKKEGLRKGVADLQLLYGNGVCFSLFIELKTDIGTQSKEQKEFEAYCIKNKYKYTICRSLDEFKNEINNYLKK